MQQSALEHLIHPYHLNQEIQTYLLETYQDDINKCVQTLEKYLSQEYWESKNIRLKTVKQLDLTKLVVKILTQVCLLASDYLPLLSVCSAVQIKGLNKQDSITTVSEILYCCDCTELFFWDIQTDNTRIIKSNMSLSDDLQRRLDIMCVLPPMVCKPRKLTRNNSCGYLTIHNDSLILGFKENHHGKCISLDVLNTLNSTALELDKHIVHQFERQFCRDELSKQDFDNLDETEQEIYLTQKNTHYKMKEQFEFFREKLLGQTIHLTHKVDKRGRVYSQGYHFNTQGTSFEKACLNLKVREFVKGEL